MPLEAALLPDPIDQARMLNDSFDPKDACGLIGHILTQPDYGRIALVSSFGADSIVLLHMLAGIDRSAPVLFLETGMLFAETLRYQQDVAAKLGLTNVTVVRPDREALFARDPDGILHLADTDGCCDLRKVEPLDRALTPFDGWITGRKRFHGGRRVTLDMAEVEGGKLKLNPLAHWSTDDIAQYMDSFDLPRHPLSAKGYASIGCAPCTSPTRAGEDPRAGRWRGKDKDECGIHFIDGKVVRG